MKRFILHLLICLFLLTMVSAAVGSDFVVENGVLTAYTGTASSVVIPGNVKSIGSSVFEGNKNIISVSYPNQVTSIGARAFYGCTNLKYSTTYDAMASMLIKTTSGKTANGTTLSGNVGKQYQYHIIPTPAGASAAVTWKSANTSVVTITSTGRATCADAGSAKITATAKDGSGVAANFTLSCLPKMTSMQIKTTSGKTANGTTLTGNVGQPYQYNIIPVPSTASDAVTWTSSNTSVVTITAAGKASCKAAGAAKITATAKDGSGVTANFTLKCVVPKMTSMSIKTSSGKVANGTTLTGIEGKPYQYTIAPTPAGASSAVTWESSKGSVVSITSGGRATCAAAGSAKITATAKDGSGITASFTLKCLPKMKSMSILTTSGKVANGLTLTGNVGKPYQYSITPNPSNASNVVTWASAKTTVVTINDSGRANCVSAGSSKITATAKDGSGVTASFTLKCIN